MEEEDSPDLPDIYVHIGPIVAPADDRLLEFVAEKPRSSRCTLYLRTFGGDPDVAYRMMRALQHAYEHITVVVWRECKSAGTLMALGADELVMFGHAQLGPLDMQIPLKDELLERQSGMAPEVAFTTLLRHSMDAYQKVFLDLKLGANMSTQMAAEAAAALVVGLHAPIYAQIDPMQVASIGRTNVIGYDYGRRLTEGKRGITNSAATISTLIANYPSHGFVIDRTEAKKLFGKKVRHPSDEERVSVASCDAIFADPITIRIQEDPDGAEPADPSVAQQSDETGAANGERPGGAADQDRAGDEPGGASGKPRKSRKA